VVGSRSLAGIFGMHNRMFGPYLAAINRILIPLIGSGEHSRDDGRHTCGLRGCCSGLCPSLDQQRCATWQGLTSATSQC
jgi:hypothetical protein